MHPLKPFQSSKTVIYNTYGNQNIVDTDHSYYTPTSTMDQITQKKEIEEDYFSD